MRTLTSNNYFFSSARTRYEHEFARLQAVVEQLEHENRDLKIHIKVSEKSAMEGGAGGILVDRDSLLAISDVTKSFARKVKSNFQQSVMNPQTSSPAHQVHISFAFQIPLNHFMTECSKIGIHERFLKVNEISISSKLRNLDINRGKIQITLLRTRYFGIKKNKA